MPIPRSALRPLAFDFGLPIGAQYYRAPTPFPETWERDLDQLRDHGMNTIKIWAQWRWGQPAEDRFYFDDLDRLMDLAAERGLRVVINTIFDVMPAWLIRAHPDSLMVRRDGRPLGPTTLPHRQIGGAPGPCLHHPEARRQRDRFLRAAVERYRAHPALWFWDLWNEPEWTCGLVRGGPAADQVCYCAHSRAAFLAWLAQRYGSLEALNRAWSRNYNAWDELELPWEPEVYADWIDWRLFFRDSITEEMRRRVQLAREVDTVHPVMCHTVPPPVFNVACCGSDDFELAAEGDLFGNSSASAPFPTDYCRSAAEGRPLVCSEIHAIPGTTLRRPTPPAREEFERYVLVPLFRGAKGFLFWQYRAECLGKEAPAWGMTRPDGTPEPWLGYCRDLSGWLQEHAHFLLEARPDPARVAVLVVPENEIFFYCHDQSLERYWAAVLGAYQLLTDAGHPVDFFHARQLVAGDAARYPYLVAPVPYAYPRAVAAALRDYVRAGGRLLAEGFPCALDPATGIASDRNPGMGLDELFGCRETAVQPDVRVGFGMAYGAGGVEQAGRPTLVTTQKIGTLPVRSKVTGRLAEQRLVATGGTVSATFADGSAAVVDNPFGKGSACLVGCWLFEAYHHERAEAVRKLVTGLLELDRPAVWSSSVGVTRLSHEDRAWLLLENSRSKKVSATVHLDAPVRAARLLPSGEAVPADGKTLKVDLPAQAHRVVEVLRASH